MTESGAKIVIKGDAKGAVDAAKQVGTELDKVGAKGKTASMQFGQMGMELTKAVGRALALKAALNAALDVSRELRKEGAEINKNIGKGVVDRDLAAAKLGISSADAAALVGSVGNKSRDELGGFLGTLASGDNAQFLDREGVFKAVGAYASGAFRDDEVLTAVKEGRVGSLAGQVPGRLAAMSPEGRAELGERAGENLAAARTYDANLARGADERREAARRAAVGAESPVADKVLGKIPLGEEALRLLQGILNDGTRLRLQAIESFNRPAVVGEVK
jgi:hypothetical protein